MDKFVIYVGVKMPHQEVEIMEEERKFMNYQIGEKVNKWTILDLHKNKWSKKSALCECECGNTSEIELSRLKNNKQCRDCYNKERKDNSIIDIVEYKKYWNINNKYGIDKVVYDKSFKIFGEDHPETIESLSNLSVSVIYNFCFIISISRHTNAYFNMFKFFFWLLFNK